MILFCVFCRYVLGYESTPLHYVDNDTALAICGNSVCQYSLSGGFNTHLMWGPGVGIQTSTLHPRQHWLAISEKVYITTKDAPKNRQISSRNATISLAWTVLKMHQNSGYFITKCKNLLHGLRSKCTTILKISSSNATISYMDYL